MISYISSGRKKWWDGHATILISSGVWKSESVFFVPGARFVYTRHNVRPHYANGIISRAYDIIESQSDIVAHMGRFSRDEFLTKYPDSQNVVIPHHIYQYTYKEDISVERARQYLNLSQDAFIVTAFGKFRNREEIRMVLGAFRAWDEEHKMLLAPRLYPFSRRNSYGRNFIKRWISKAGYYLLMPLLNRMYKLQAGANDELIDNCDLPYYMAASDVIFIQRKDILNSGNVPSPSSTTKSWWVPRWETSANCFPKPVTRLSIPTTRKTSCEHSKKPAGLPHGDKGK